MKQPSKLAGWMALMVVVSGAPAWADEPGLTGELRVQSSQPGALVFVDRKMVGNAPVDIKVTPGVHRVRVSLDQNWFPFDDSVDIKDREVVSVNANLHRSAWSFFQEGVTDYGETRMSDAAQAFQASLDSPGKQNPANYFYLGLMAENAKQYAAAAQDYTQYLNYRDSSAAGHYHLGLTREALGQAGQAATSYKLALFRLLPQAEGWTRSAPPLSAQALKKLQPLTDLQHRVQYAYLQELKGNVDGARALYRALVEAQGADLGHPQTEMAPEAPDPIAIPAPSP